MRLTMRCGHLRMTPVSSRDLRDDRERLPVTAMSSFDAAKIAAAFVAARRAAKVLVAYPGPLPDSLAAAYRIQDEAIALQGSRIAGWKVGRIWPPHEGQYGSNRLAGPIAAERVFMAGDETVAMPVFAGGFGAVEAEFICVLGTVDPARHDYTLAKAADMITAVHVGIEIASSPFAAINDHGPAVTVSDFGNNHGVILGPAIIDWQAAAIDDWPVCVTIDGDPVGQGRAAGFPDGVVGSVRFLLELSARRGIALPAGTLVSTGAISGVHPIAAGQLAEARFADRHVVPCRIVAARPEPA